MNSIVPSATPVFTLRAAAIIVQDDRVLLCKNNRHSCFYFVGGRIEKNESSESAILRECLEETGHNFQIDRLACVLERFYSAENTPRHEITFFYLMKEASFSIPDGMNTDRNDERLYWIYLEQLDEIDLVPPVLKPEVKNLPEHPLHIISYK